MDVRLPKLGEGADSGTVVSLLVKEGDTVNAGQTLLELENEKAVAPIPAPAGGVVANIRVKAGDKLSVGQVILSIEEGKQVAAKPADSKAEKPAPSGEPKDVGTESPAEPAPTADHEPAASKPGLTPAASPSIRKLARELGIDLTRVKGSEPGGRIVLGDVRAYIERLQKLAVQPKPAAAPAAVPAVPSVTAPPPISVDFSQWGPIVKKPLTLLRKTISRRMQENWNAIPHVTQFDESDITALDELRKKYAPAYEQKGARLTLTSFALKAVATMLKQHPIFNCSLDETTNEIVFKDYCHIGLAVDTEAGLIVPVIRDVDKKDMLQLSREVNELAEKARARKISLEEMRGGSFTISNQGGIGSGHFTPIINRPEAAILGLGRGTLKPVVKDGKIEPRLMLPIAVSYDHRIIDGGKAARFVVELVQAFENFSEAVVRTGALE